MTTQLHSVVYKEGKYYVSQCLDVDVVSFGHTKKESLDNLQEALDLYFEDIPRKKKFVSVSRPVLHTLSVARV